MSSSKAPHVWLITGCSSGFGWSLALLAIRAGHQVIATSRDPSKSPELVKQIETLGGIWMPLNINSNKEVLQSVIAKGLERFGRLDVLVNNAGVSILGPLEDITQGEARWIMDTNFFGPMNLIQAALPTMRTQGSGTIVNISSAAGIDPRPAMAAYGASKFALEGMSQSLAKEVEPFGIRVLIVEPGAFTTRIMNDTPLNSKPLSKGYEDTEVGKFMAMFDESGGKRRAFTAPNDVEKGCQGIFEVVTGTGRGEGKENYLRLPLSKDVAQRTKDHAERLVLGYEAFRDIWENTEHDGGISKAFVTSE